MCSAYSPDSSERYAIDFPSGDHAGSRSTTAVVLVKLRMSPFSAGTVKISPRTPNTARAPVGEMSAERILLGSIFRKCGRTSARSATGWIFSARYLFLNAGVGKASDPDRLGLPAAITLPGPLPLQVGHVSDARAVGRKGAFRSSHQGNLGCKTALQGNGKKLNYAARECGSE